ncbi:hypothetical protein, partial [Segatella salivae]|uniref:hypothetical protein n=1 Tax=Segatella salivae TaxID=228604 RepID=UPI0028D2A0FB
LKTVVPRGTGGSNPSLSANKGVNQQVMRFTPFITPKNLRAIKKNYTQAIILGMTFGIGEFIRFYNDETTSSLASLAERHCGDCL